MENLETRVIKLEDTSKNFSVRLDSVEKQQHDILDLMISNAKILQRLDRIEKDVSESKVDIKTLMSKPGKRWEAIVEKILLCIITGLVSFALIKLGLAV